ncbi:hypothetical protein LINPERPRIM_LOCUS9140 [Linum perenne]
MAKSFAFFQSVFSSSAAVAEESPILVQGAATVVESGGDLSSYWEFINASDADSSDTESVLSVENGFVSLPASSDHFLLTAAAEEEAVPDDDVKEEDYKESCDGSAKEEAIFVVEDRAVFRRPIVVSDYTSYADHYSGLYGKREEVEEDEEEEEEEEYGLDEDELVRGKLGSGRMRKLGKRACAKMSNSKRDPYRYVKRGCLYGKHKA